MSPLIAQHETALQRLCVEFGVQRLELFGSACTSAFDPSHSDLDFLVEFPAGYHFGPWMSRFVELRRRLAELFGRPVDLVMPSALENRFFREEAEKTRTVIYDGTQVSQVA